MNSKMGKYLVITPILLLLVACAQLGPVESHNPDDRKVTQEAKTPAEHSNLAIRYDELAKDMLAKVEEKKESLEEYEDHSYYYGRQGQDFKSHTQANIRYYEQAAADAARQADNHRKIAAELLQQQRNYARPAETPGQAGSLKIKAKLNSNNPDGLPVKTQ